MSPGTVHQNVNGPDILHQCRNVVELCDVEGTIRATLAQLFLGSLQLSFVTANNNHFGTSLHKNFRDAQTQSAATASHHGPLSVNSKCFHVYTIFLQSYE